MVNKNGKLKAQLLELLERDRKFRLEILKLISKEKNGLVTTTYLDRALAKLSKEFVKELAKQSREFDEKLAKQSREFDEKLTKQSKEFDEKLAKQSREFDEKLTKQSKEFDEKLAKQSKEFDEKLFKLREDLSREFDEKLAKQSKEFDEKLFKLREDLSREFDEKLAKQSKEFDEKLIKQKNEIVKEIKDFINAKFGEIGSRWGKDAEITLKTFMQEVLTKEFNAKVEKWTYKGIIKEIDPIRDRYEVDICVISDGRILLIEYKSRAEYEDVVGFIKNCMGYERITGKKATRKILVCVSAEEEAKIFAQNNNIEFFYRTF